MNFKTLIWKNLHARVWLLVSSITMVVIFTATMILTQVPLLRYTLDIVFGRPQAILGGARELYTTSEGIDDKDSAYAAGNALNIEIAAEGTILLKNAGNVLPLAAGSKISVFGKNSTNLLYGGSGSGGYATAEIKTIFESLTGAGFTYNTTLESFYKNNAQSGPSRMTSPTFGDIVAGFPTAETPVSSYIANNIPASYADHNTALVVLTRIGGEGFDLPRTMKRATTGSDIAALTNENAWNDSLNVAVDGARDKNSHYLQLDKNEAELFAHVTENFEKVIVVINSNNNLELGFLDDPSYWTDVLGVPDQSSKIQGAVWIGSPGAQGIMALGKILSGAVNPSGRTVSTHARDFTKDPTYNNFGNNNVYMGDSYLLPDGSLASAALRQYFTEYEEGIYVGYRYYETRALNDAAWYKNNVVFPMGYGLSYSEFDWTLGDVKLDGTVISDNHTLTAADANKTLSIDVTVKNKATSTKAGKDVVQLYVSAPYTSGGIEKAHVTMAAFDKTGLLQPGASETLTLKFSPYDIASYDYNDDNGNGFKGWETEGGKYSIYVSRNSNSWQDGSALGFAFSVPQTQTNATKGSTGFTYRKDPTTGKDVVNRFDDVSYGREGRAEDIVYLSRADWDGTWPKVQAEKYRLATQAWMQALTWRMAENDVEGKPWYKTADQMPKQAASPVSQADAIQLIDLLGVDYDDELWDDFLDQFTVDQMANLIDRGAFGTGSIENLGVPLTLHYDGPVGWTNFMANSLIYGVASYTSQTVMGATYSTRLAYAYGQMIGDEGLIGDSDGDGLSYSGWYAPGVNIHRSPFSGRNWEYYSEDPVLSGKMAARVIIGAKEKGVITFAKHFALNDQETNREQGILTWASEQSMREIYLKAFEILVKESETLGIMSSFNRIGTTWTGGDYRLLTDLLRGEWDFKGVIITDYAVNRYQNPNQMVRAGGDLNLHQSGGGISNDANNPTQVHALRAATKNILFAILNSSAMNYEILGYKWPVWMTALLWVNIGLLVGFILWGGAAIYLSYKKLKGSDSSGETVTQQ